MDFAVWVYCPSAPTWKRLDRLDVDRAKDAWSAIEQARPRAGCGRGVTLENLHDRGITLISVVPGEAADTFLADIPIKDKKYLDRGEKYHWPKDLLGQVERLGAVTSRSPRPDPPVEKATLPPVKPEPRVHRPAKVKLLPRLPDFVQGDFLAPGGVQ